jgi:hypothetical protein
VLAECWYGLDGVPAMNGLEINVVEEDGILRFALKGPGTHANLIQAAATINSETKAREVWNVLCDTTAITAAPGAFEKFEAGVELARGADRRMKMAVVARLEVIDYIFENVARNRGVSVAVFRDEVAAMQWLKNAQTG